MDSDGYPEPHELARIREWDITDCVGLMSWAMQIAEQWCGSPECKRIRKCHLSIPSGTLPIVCSTCGQEVECPHPGPRHTERCRWCDELLPVAAR